jgi:hypothetical protein
MTCQMILVVSLGAVGSICGACSGSPSTTTASPASGVLSIAVDGSAPTIGTTTRFTALARLSDGSTQTVTTQATWQSSVPSVATVTNTGMVTGVSGGSTDITATYLNVSGVVHFAIGTFTPVPAPPPSPVPF